VSSLLFTHVVSATGAADFFDVAMILFTTGRVLEEVTSSAASASHKFLCVLSLSQCKHCLF
jgi:hypothetical protein